ncbi:hypothetical protein Ssi03_25960 [Sphaerisporangium siamense]|uniref:Uncharacterized protein n=1 Tax=Sphaerisporangium siamense TaxID=795645 RepID=A0A7W7D4K1_9ACTN|nr:hypothetical protein [Sphaerisporangium siamense]MBB4700077.1 hypothetical protein [Sphaerisporangium siamense]GII84606.1 hypothetical protein Ssi03_25960 [Sphaerisporangium siamense]
MAIVQQYLVPEEAHFLGSAFPAFDKINGTNFPVSRLLYDATNIESAYWKIEAVNYASGSWACELIWYAVNATTGTCRWRVAVAAITPDSDSQDVETKALATAQAVDDAHLGTTSKRLHKAVLSISNLDSVAAGDEVWVQVSREANHANDTLANDAALTSVRLSYSDT